MIQLKSGPKSIYSKYTMEDLIKAVKESYSVDGVLKKLNLTLTGGNRKTIKRKVRELNLDTSHFTGMLWSKGKKITNPIYGRSLDEILIKNSPYKSDNQRLIRRLLNADLIIYQCNRCAIIDSWNNKPITLQLHHKDGDNQNYEIENLELLCPNCHSQTENFNRPKKIVLT